MKTKKIIHFLLSQNTRILFGLFMLVGLQLTTNAQTTVTYTQRIANYYASSNNGGTFGNNGNYQVGMTAHASSPKQVVAWRKFRQDGSAGSSSDRSMQIGDQFVVTVSATKAYGLIGFSLLSSPSATASFTNRESNYAVSVYLPGALYGSWGNWTIKSNGGTTATASFGGNQSPTWKNFTFTMTLTAVDRMNITMTDGTTTSYFFDVQLAQSSPITDYSIYQEDDWDGGGNMGCYWGLGADTNQHTLTDRGSMSLGSSNTSFSVSGVLTNGFAANSTTSSVNNSLTKVGNGNITLSATNTYSGTTQIDGGSLILGINNAIPSGASGVQSAVTFNGGTLSTGASSAGFSCGTSSYPMGVLTIGSGSASISLAASSNTQNLYFANSSSATWTGNLTISGWSGTAGSTGTNGHIFVGNSSSGLTASQLARITFSGYSGSFATILSTGEIVPAVAGNPAPLFFCSGNFNPPNSWSEKNSAYMTPLSGKAPTNSSSYSLQTTSSAGTVYFKFFSDVSGSGFYYGPSSNSTVSLSTAFAMPTDSRANGNSYTFNGTSGNKYLIKTNGTTSINASAVVFDLGASGVVRTVSSVTQSPSVSSVYAGYASTVTATISGAFTGTQIPYLRYSTSATFATSTVVAMSGSGTTYSATIPSGTNVAGNPVYYYVFTSGSGGTNPAADGFDADLFSINYNDNAGTNYSYTPIAGSPDITFSVSSPGSGSSGYVGNTVTITGTNLSGINSLKVGGASGIAVSLFTVVNPTTITFNAIDATGTLWLTDGTATATSAATYTNLGYISTANGDWNTGSTWLGGAIPSAASAVQIANAVTLNATATNNPVSVTINSGKSLTLGTSGALTINAGGSLTNNGTASLGGVGLVTFAGTATITGASTFNNLTLNGTTTLNNAPTVNGTLIMNSGTTLLTNSPVYGSAAILNYNLNNGYVTKYNQSLEWPASAGPSSVILSSNSWIQLTGDRSLTGDLTITGGALQAHGALRTLTMSGTTQTINLSGGAVYGTENGTNNDLQLTIASGSTTTFTGNATASADDEKKFFNINVNSGGTLALSRGILCKHGSFTVNGTLQINLNGYIQSNNTTNGALATTNAAANYSSGGSIVYNTGGSFTVTDKEWPTTNYPLNVTIQNPGTTVVLNNSKTIGGDLSIASGAILDLGAYTANRGSSGGTLTVAGTMNLGGISGGQTGSNFPINFSTVTIDGTVNYNAATGGQTIYTTPVYTTLAIGNTSGTQSVAGNLTVSNLTINSSGSLLIAAGKQLTVSSTMSNGGTLNLLSDATGTATILTPASISGSGTVNVKQYMESSRNWYMSSPVSGASSLPTVDTGTPTFYSYTESDANQATGVNGYAAGAVWNTVSAGTMAIGTGYIVKPSITSTLTFTGTGLNTGDQTVSGLTYTSANPKHGFNLIGNPYPSYVNLATFTSISDTVHLESSYWLRSRNAGNSAYVFDTYNLKTPAASISLSGKPLVGVISPMQSFWVRIKNGFNSGSLTFRNSKRSHIDDSNNILRVPVAKTMTQSLLRLQVSNGLNYDETVLYSNTDASNGFDDYDSRKYSNGSASIPEIFTTTGSDQLAINGMNSIPYDTEIPLGFSTGSIGNFSIKASQILNFDRGTQVILRDKLFNAEQDLTASDYTFNSDISETTNRFSLIFKAPSVSTGISNYSNNNVWIYKNANNQIMLNGTPTSESSVSVYNISGQKMIVQKLTEKNTLLQSQLDGGVYLVTLKNAGKTTTVKIIID